MKKRQKIRAGLILFSFFLFPATFYYLSPVLAIQASAAGVINGSLIMFGLMFCSALFFGRAYCGWLCPAAGCQEAIVRARDKHVLHGNYVKWLIWIPWIGTIIFFALKAGGYSKIDFLYQTVYGLSVSDLQSFLTYNLVLFILIVLPAFLIGKRAFCHHLCWMAPFMILGRKLRNKGKWPALQLHAVPEKCIHCHICTNSCPMSLPVEGMVYKNFMENSECILCGTCVDSCEQSAILFKIKNHIYVETVTGTGEQYFS